MPQYVIKPLEQEHLAPAMELVWDVFLEFEAPDYEQEGIDEFRRYIQPEQIQNLLDKEDLFIWGCYLEEEVVGVIAVRPPCHISLLFVKTAHHRKGLSWRLFNEMRGWCRAHTEATEITVHSSAYAVEVYKKLGFVKTGSERVENGIPYIPMKRSM